ncbi:hypothetical protein DAPPUDRAFT_328093 [Daphnia pulex]|uniref:Uncharacterized protein n=1 Tax=Daphnia pulex TaxID=6669 RepID=E9HCH4_DAPPU|nr:hypothetical protein DAPPUDRAFT_328093 [Daphnia pulex]|eukprot:EFX70533.1 hypothetical protein DAPPUDRAFT_328093 [Daphnia pulex]
MPNKEVTKSSKIIVKSHRQQTATEISDSSNNSKSNNNTITLGVTDTSQNIRTCSMANDTSSTVFIDVDNLSERNDDLLQRIIDLERKLQVAKSKFEELNSKLKEMNSKNEELELKLLEKFKDHALAESICSESQLLYITSISHCVERMKNHQSGDDIHEFTVRQLSGIVKTNKRYFDLDHHERIPPLQGLPKMDFVSYRNTVDLP